MGDNEHVMLKETMMKGGRNENATHATHAREQEEQEKGKYQDNVQNCPNSNKKQPKTHEANQQEKFLKKQKRW